jgi:hypothetical protein
MSSTIYPCRGYAPYVQALYKLLACSVLAITPDVVPIHMRSNSKHRACQKLVPSLPVILRNPNRKKNLNKGSADFII